jgi:hypothetical protein
MTDSASRITSLNEIGLKYISSLQRLSTEEQTYDELSRSIPGLPSTEFHISFAAVKEEAARWCLKHSANEILGLTVMFLEEIRKLCALVAFNAARIRASGDLATLAAELNSRPQLPDPAARFKQLRERYDVISPLEAEIVSLTAFAKCLFKTNGVVVGSGAPLTLKLKTVHPPAEGESQARISDFHRSWSAGETLTLTREGHAAIFTTISLFFGNLLNSVQEYAKRSGLPVDAPDSERK